MHKKKSNSLLSMLLRNGKQKKDFPIQPTASSTPLDMSLEQNIDTHTPSSQLNMEGGSEVQKRVQFSPYYTSVNPSSSEIPPFSWDTYGFPEGVQHQPETEVPSTQDDPTPPTRIVTPDIDQIEQSVLRTEVELSSFEYNVPNPLEYFQKVKYLGNYLDSYCSNVEFAPAGKVERI